MSNRLFAIPFPSCPKRLPKLFFGQTRARPSRTRTQCVAEHEAFGVAYWAAHLLATSALLTDVIKDILIMIVVVIALRLGYCVLSTAGSRGSFRRRNHPLRWMTHSSSRSTVVSTDQHRWRTSQKKKRSHHKTPIREDLLSLQLSLHLCTVSSCVIPSFDIPRASL